MKPSALLRTLSSRIPARLLSSPAVAPLPSPSRFDNLVTSELHALRLQEEVYGSGYTRVAFLADALGASIAAQKIALDCLPNVSCGDRDNGGAAIDEYLEDSAQLLDACRDLSATMDMFRGYVESLQVVIHSLRGRFPPCAATLARASQALESCEAMKMNMKCSFISRKLSQKQGYGAKTSAELSEILSGSSAIASTVFQLVGMALSLKSKRAFPTLQCRPTSSWSGSLQELQKGLEEEMKRTRKSGGSVMLTELRETVMATQELRIQFKNQKQDELGSIVEELKRGCEALEQGVKTLDEKVNALYRHLISLRMALLGILSQP